MEGSPDRNANVPDIRKKKEWLRWTKSSKASYLPEKATFNDLASNKISKKEVTPKKKIIRLKQKFMWKL